MSFSLVSNFVGTIAMLLTVIQLIGPISKVYEGLKITKIIDLDYKIILVSVLNTGLWIIYGLKLSSFPIYLTNFALYMIYLFFLNAYLWINHEEQNMYKYTGGIIICWTLSYYILPKDLAGFFAFIVNIGLSYTLVQRIHRTLLKKNNQEMNLIELQLSSGAAALWVIYGLYLTNLPLIWIPHMIALLLFGIAILTFQWTIGKIEDRHFLIINLKKVFQVKDEKCDDIIVENQNHFNKRLKEDF